MTSTPHTKVLSFDVFGTLINVREGSYGAFERILRETGAGGANVKAFWESWEERNIAVYWARYRPYKASVAKVSQRPSRRSALRGALKRFPPISMHFGTSSSTQMSSIRSIGFRDGSNSLRSLTL